MLEDNAMCVFIKSFQQEGSPVVSFEDKEAILKELSANHANTSISLVKVLPSGIKLPHYVDVVRVANGEVKLRFSYGSQSELNIEQLFS